MSGSTHHGEPWASQEEATENRELRESRLGLRDLEKSTKKRGILQCLGYYQEAGVMS